MEKLVGHYRIRRLMLPVMCFLMMAGAIPLTSVAQTPDISTAPSYEETVCVRELPASLVEGESASCGVVTAPMYPDGESSEVVRLSVIRIASTSATPAPEPLLILTGGPGQALDSVLLLFGDAVPLYRPVLETQEVILFDQRGMGLSEPSLACPFEQPGAASATPVATPGANLEAADLSLEAALEPLFACGQQLRDASIDPAAFTTITNAADIDAIRVAIGVDQVDLYGVSYGTELALAAMRHSPDAIDSVVLGSALPLEANFLLSQITAFDEALKAIFAACDADPECAAANPDPEGTLERVVADLTASPITLMPVSPVTGEPVEVPVDGALFLNLLYTSIFIGEGIPFIPGIITSTLAGDTTIIEGILSLSLIPAPTAQGALYTFVCQGEYPFITQAEIDQVLADTDALEVLRGGAFVGVTALAFPVCEAWGFPAAGEEINHPVHSEIPTLIVGGGFDPITPPQFSEDVAANLPNSTLVIVPGLGHDPITTVGDCTIGLAASFLADPTAPFDTSCAAAITPDFSPAPPPGASPVASPVS